MTKRVRKMISAITDILDKIHARYQIIEQEKPVLSAADAQEYYPPEKAAPTFVLQTENGLIGCIVSSENGRLDFEQLKREFGYRKLKLADRKQIATQTGFEVGAIPLVGLGLPCLFDRKLLQYDFVYGGTGDVMKTLKIAPEDLLMANEIIGMFG